MPDLPKLAKGIGEQYTLDARHRARATLFVKCALVIGGASVAAVAECVELAKSAGEYSGWTFAGLAAAGLVALGGIYVALTETDSATALEEARKAIEAARELDQENLRFAADRTRLNKEVTRGLELYNSMDVMRGAIEQSLGISGTSATAMIQTCLSAASNSLTVAFDFDIQDTWTVCVFKAVPEKAESDKIILECVAHIRKIPCEIGRARKWREGEGVAGVSYSMGNDIIVPDMAARELGSIFNLKGNTREYDLTRYRSMVAIPIRIGQTKIPWGITVVTSNQPSHFTLRPVDGVSTTEPARAIAAMAALAVRATEPQEIRSAPAVQP